MSTPDLDTIVQQLRNGNNQILSFIFVEHGQWCIRNLRKKYNASQEDAEDALMESVINFREKAIRGEITFLQNIRNYVYTTCCNMWLKKYENKKRLADKVPEIQRFFYEEFQAFDPESGEEPGYQEELIRTTLQGVNTLGERCQSLLKFFYIENRRMKEIASQMGFANENVAKSTKLKCFKSLVTEVESLLKTRNISIN